MKSVRVPVRHKRAKVKDPCLMLIKNISEHVRKEFKAECALRGVGMNWQIEELMRQFIARAKERRARG